MSLKQLKNKYFSSKKIDINGLLTIGILGIFGGILNKVVRTWPRLWGNDLGLSVRIFDILAILGMFYSMKLFWGPLLSLRLPTCLPFSPRRFWIAVHLWLFGILFCVVSFCNIFSGFVFFACTTLLFMLDGNYSMLVVACQKDTVSKELRGIPESVCLNGYRAGMTIAISGALFFSDHDWSWPELYRCLAGTCFIMGACILWLSRFDSLDRAPIQSFKGMSYSFLSPIKQLFKHPQIRNILFILMLFRVADHLWTPNQELFFLHMGFSKQQYSIQDIWNFWGSSVGIFFSGYCIRRFSILRVMQWGLFFQMVVFFGLFWSSFGASFGILSVLCVLQRIILNFALTSVFAFQIMAVNLSQAITQLSIFTALAHLNSQFVSSCSGWLIAHCGWSGMIFISVLACIPALLFMCFISKENFLRPRED